MVLIRVGGPHQGLSALAGAHGDADSCPVLIDEGLEILSEGECWRLLASQTIGRVGLSLGALPAIFPVNFVLEDGNVVFRTGEGLKLKAALNHTVVAFEVDGTDVEARGGWSVLVVGVAEALPPGNPIPAPAGPDTWVGGERNHLVRIRPEVLTGRRISWP